MKPLFFILIALAITGCKSTEQINMLPTYSYEGVYNSDVPIIINGVDVKRESERVWILSDTTLSYIIFDAKHHYYKTSK